MQDGGGVIGDNHHHHNMHDGWIKTLSLPFQLPFQLQSRTEARCSKLMSNPTLLHGSQTSHHGPEISHPCATHVPPMCRPRRSPTSRTCPLKRAATGSSASWAEPTSQGTYSSSRGTGSRGDTVPSGFKNGGHRKSPTGDASDCDHGIFMCGVI
jgi:hypothetical protein